MTAAKSILDGWELEKEFAKRWKKRTGFGSYLTLYRWRRQNTVPRQLEWMKAGRAVFWREKPTAA
jgi:hypothetical protein